MSDSYKQAVQNYIQKRTRARRGISRKRWADWRGLPTGVLGEVVNGISMIEANRATGFEYHREGIEELVRIRDKSYRSKNVSAQVFGVDDGESIAYAVFVQDGFLTEVTEDEELGEKGSHNQTAIV